jgi:hypothetical protein
MMIMWFFLSSEFLALWVAVDRVTMTSARREAKAFSSKEFEPRDPTAGGTNVDILFAVQIFRHLLCPS